MNDKQHTSASVAEFFSNSVNWDHFYSAVDTLGDTLNSPKNRFDKSDILELAIDVFSDGKIQHYNKTGRDFFIPSLSIYCEMKYETNLLFTASKQIKATTTLTLVNTMGNNNRDRLPDDYAPFLIAVGSLGCAVVDKATLESHLDTKSDSGQIKAKDIPKSKFLFVRTPNQLQNRRVVKNIDYSQEKLKLQKAFLNKFKTMLQT
jgi:hypothetical protein